MQLYQASRQWSSRPADERFLNLYELHAKVSRQHNRSRGITLSSRDIEVQPHAKDGERGLQVVNIGKDSRHIPYTPTNWSFGQLATLGGAPGGYLRKLPAPMAAACINYGMQNMRDVENIGLLITADNDENTVRAATGPNYGRIWNDEIVSALIDQHGDGITGKFRVPGIFGKPVDVDKRNTTIYGSDRDMFVFLADEENRITVPNRRNGKSGSLAKGFFTWNSEVGSSSIGAAFFLFDEVCENRIVWGAEGFKEIRISHTASAPHRWIEEITPVLVEYANASSTSVAETIKAAQQKRVDDDLTAFLAKYRFSGSQITQIKASHEREEDRPIETLWDAVTGVTAYAKTIEHQDDRVAIERMGGKLLDLAA